VRRLAPLVLAAAGAIAFAGCGGGAAPRQPAPAAKPLEAPTGLGADFVAPGSVPREGTVPADPEAVRVIRRWMAAVRRNDIHGAALLWARPSVFQNVSPVRTLRTLHEIERVNSSFPCGAVGVGFAGAGEFTVVRFRLVSREGAPGCGVPSGATTRGAIRVRDGHIDAWYRLYEPGEARPGPDPVNPGADAA
jgi:hypothetical protein